MHLCSIIGRRVAGFAVLAAVLAVAACSDLEGLPPPQLGDNYEAPNYQIGPGDVIEIFVWRNPELSTAVPVRPDGRISIPLIEDIEVAGKTPTEVSREIEEELSVFIKDPLVTVMVSSFVGTFEQTVRVVGQAQEPRSLPYRTNMTVLDVMIAVGGLTEFAAGNRATLVRVVDDDLKQYRVRLDDLLQEGEIEANVAVLPGDVLIIPEAFF